MNYLLSGILNILELVSSAEHESLGNRFPTFLMNIWCTQDGNTNGGKVFKFMSLANVPAYFFNMKMCFCFYTRVYSFGVKHFKYCS